MKIAVLGAGLVGGTIARDLATEDGFEVCAWDAHPKSLAPLNGLGIQTHAADLRDKTALSRAIDQAQLVVGAVPGALGFETLRHVIDTGHDVVDISFFPEEPWELDALAKDRRVTALVDCGLAPGLSNIMAGWSTAAMESVERFVCYVGGLPLTRRKPFEYAAVFSPRDVIEEYTRPARIVEKGEVVVRPALTEVEALEFPRVGTLEAFNTDGLRTLAQTLSIPDMQEKTMRYPGHAALMGVFRDAGFFDETPLNVAGTEVRPVDLTAALLTRAWHMKPGDQDCSVMRVLLRGTVEGARREIQWDLWDQYDEETQTTSMARTTGFTCTEVARMVAEGSFKPIGLVPPERLGADLTAFGRLMKGLEGKGIRFTKESRAVAD